jgi:hypothetical protein
MVAEKLLMLSEGTTHLEHMVEGWSVWMRKGGDWVRRVRKNVKIPIFFTVLKTLALVGLEPNK